MSGLVKWLRERVHRSAPSGNLLAAHATVYGETPAISFEDYMEAYVRDPSCKAFVDFLADQIVGMGFYTTANEKYAQAQEAKQSVNEFCEDVNLDGLLQIGVRETVACGNSFWEKIEPDRLETLRILPLTSIDKIKRDIYGNVQGYVQSPTYGGKTLAPERILHFKWNPVNGEPFGTGILRSLLEQMKIGNETRMSFLEMKARIEKMLPEIFEKYAGPDELWIFEGVSDDQLGTYQNTIRNKPKAGARFVYNKPADIKTVQIDPRTQFQSYLDHIVGQVNIGGQSPVSSLMISPNYLTKATAEAALDLADRKVLSAQRYVKRIIEREIFDPVVEQAGYDAQRAAVRLNWGIPERPVVQVSDLIRAGELGLVRSDEFRNIMKKMGWELAEPQPTAEPEAVPIPEGLWTGAMRTLAEQEQCRWVTLPDGRKVCIKPRKPREPSYSRRDKFANSHAEKFPEETRKEVARRLKRYRAEDLKDADIRANTELEIIRATGGWRLGYYDEEIKSVHVLKSDPSVLDHEMAHYLTEKKFGTTRPAKYSKFLQDKYKKVIKKYLGGPAVRNEAELIAEAFDYMRNNPVSARSSMEKSPEMRELLYEITNDFRYRIREVRRR